MKKFSALIVALALMCGLLTGCGSKPAETTDNGAGRVITDCAGVEVEVPEKIERVVCTSASVRPPGGMETW